MIPGRRVLLGLLAGLTLIGAAHADERLDFSSERSVGFDHAMEAMLAESGLGDLDLSVAEADFNGDGQNDVFAFASSQYFCGSGGCGPRLYIAGKKGWSELPFYGLGEPENWSLLDETENGYRKLATVDGDGERVFAFDGEAYDEAD